MVNGSNLLGGKGRRRLLVPLVQETFSRLGIRSCDAIHGAYPQGESARVGGGSLTMEGGEEGDV